MLNKQLISEYNKTRESKNTTILCHAPFSSMNFDQNGNATVCCYNRTHILGVYPKDTITDIWFGKKADQLRDYIQNNDLSKGCTVCLNQIKSKNFYGTRARHFDCYAEENELVQSKRRLPFFSKPEINIQMPKVMEFELSNVCNLECIMCDGHFSSSIRRNREKLPPLTHPYDDRFVEQLEEFIPHLTDAKFLGGEPFLIDIYYKIWEKIKILNPEITVHITTSGAVLHQKTKNLLEDLKCGIILSIDSLHQENYEQIRRNANFERFMDNFQYFLEYTRRKNTWLSLAVCPMTKNWYEIPDIIDFCNAHKISICFNTLFKPEEYSLRFLPKFILEKIIFYYKKVELAANTELERQNRHCFLDLINQLDSWLVDKMNQEKLPHYLEKKIEKFLIANANVAQDIREKENTTTITEYIINFLLRYFYYKREFNESEFPNESPNYVNYLNNLIEFKETLFLNLTKLKREIGYESFLKMYLKALCQLNTLINKGQEDPRCKQKTTTMYHTIVQHKRKDVIIDEIYWLDPSYLLTTINEMCVREIQQQYETSY